MRMLFFENWVLLTTHCIRALPFIIPLNMHSSPMGKAVLLPLSYRGGCREPERLETCSKSEQLWNWEWCPSPTLTTTPHCLLIPWGSLFHGVPKPCVPMKSSGFVFTYSPWRPLGSAPTIGCPDDTHASHHCYPQIANPNPAAGSSGPSLSHSTHPTLVCEILILSLRHLSDLYP